jgi:cytochrome c peroxidase
MKRYLTLIVFFFLLVITSSAFLKQNPIDQVRGYVLRDMESLKHEIAMLKEQASLFKEGKSGVAALQQQLDKTRSAFKKTEYFLEYFFASYVKEHINGAPLPHLDPDEKLPHPIDPRGLQVLDELIYSAEAKTSGTAIFSLAEELDTRFAYLYIRSQKLPIEQYQLIEAVRLELIRLFTLGVTGFDTPGSANALTETQVVVKTLEEAIQPILSQVDNAFATTSEINYNKGVSLLQATSFEEFDRLAFLQQYVNPQYALYLQVHQRLQLETAEETYGTIRPWNFYSNNLFAADFLDPYYYTNLLKSQDTPELRALGRQLFYDQRLSNDGRLSCASCHKSELGFTDGVAKSSTNDGLHTVQRNAPTLLNAVYADRFFYDLRTFDLEQQAEHVILSKEEFNTSYAALLEKLKTLPEYRASFAKAFKEGNPVNRYNFSMALSAYVGSLRAHNSAFDRYVRGERTALSPKAKKGFNLFMGKAACGTCHFAPTFSGLVPPLYTENESEVLGVLVDPKAETPVIDPDLGRTANRMLGEQAYFYDYSFKTTTVRNVDLTAPYFHNGAYETLEEVVEFYNKGGGQGYGLVLPHQTLPGEALELTKKEQEAIIAFMQSLTDKGAY